MKLLFECVSCGCGLPGRHDREGICHACVLTKPNYEGCEEMYSQEALDFQEQVRLNAIWNEIIKYNQIGDEKESFKIFKEAMQRDN